MSNTNQIQGSGIGCFSAPEMITNEGIKELTGESEGEVARRFGIEYHTDAGASSSAHATEQGAGRIVWKTLILPVMVNFSAKDLAESDTHIIKTRVLEELFARLEAAEKTQNVENFLPEGRTLKSLVGNIFITDCRTNFYADLIGRLTIPSIKDETPMPYTRSCGAGERGNFMFYANHEAPGASFKIRNDIGGEISQSWLAKHGGGFSVRDLKSLNTDSSKQKFIVPRNSPVVKLLEDNLRRNAQRRTGYQRGEKREKVIAQYQSFVSEMRRDHFGVTENPVTTPGNDLYIPISIYNKALAVIAKEDESRLTLEEFLKKTSVSFFRAHRSESCFELDGDMELKGKVTNLSVHHTRMNFVKFNLVLYLGRGTKK